MSLGDWGAIEGAQRAASYGPVTVTAPGSANTKGAWVQLAASAPFDVAGLLLMLTVSVVNGAVLADIGIGAAGSEQVLIPNLQVRRIGSVGHGTVPLLLPVSIPAGTRIAVRYQGSATGFAVTAAATLLAAAWNAPAVGGRVATYGALTASSSGTVVDPGASANTKGAWTELASAADFDSSWLLLSVMPTATAMTVGTTYLLDVGIGAAGSEQIVLPDLSIYVTGSVETALYRLLLPLSIPAGSRIAARAQCSSATTPGREREIVAHLIG